LPGVNYTGAPAYLIVAGQASSYHVAFEAALLLRIVQVPAEQRVNLTEKREAREKVISQVEKLVKGSLCRPWRGRRGCASTTG
jgi:hypothetical protein